jgi:hypothetical protein
MQQHQQEDRQMGSRKQQQQQHEGGLESKPLEQQEQQLEGVESKQQQQQKGVEKKQQQQEGESSGQRLPRRHLAADAQAWGQLPVEVLAEYEELGPGAAAAVRWVTSNSSRCGCASQLIGPLRLEAGHPGGDQHQVLEIWVVRFGNKLFQRMAISELR